MPDIKTYCASFNGPTQIDLVGPLCKAYQAHPSTPVIFVDAGAHWRQGVEGISVGDGDSFKGPMDVSLPEKKDESDLAFALRHLPVSITSVVLHGFLGGRRDHELFNLGEVHRFLQNRTAQVTFDNSLIAASSGLWPFEFMGLFSLFTLSTETIVTMQGKCRYSLQQTPLPPLSSMGLSNVADGAFSIESNRPFFVSTVESL